MAEKFPKLTKSEREVLDTLWNAEKALTSSQIVASSAEHSWKPSYIHILLNSLLKKDAIEVAGFEQSTKNYARTFQPTLTREEYASLEVQQTVSKNTISALVAAFVDSTTDEAVIDELSEKLARRKKELERGGKTSKK